ncbi:MAG: helix-turn-helix transcriptional regulator [Treponema sp.]|nr:helix-turn-helix transcriptional regulator [Treponema sp.]
MSLQETFAKNLKSLRKKRNITQEKLAELCNTDTCYISQIETQRRFPSVQLIEKFADVLQIDAGELFTSKSNIEKQKQAAFKKAMIKEISNTIDKFMSDK